MSLLENVVDPYPSLIPSNGGVRYGTVKIGLSPGRNIITESIICCIISQQQNIVRDTEVHINSVKFEFETNCTVGGDVNAGGVRVWHGTRGARGVVSEVCSQRGASTVLGMSRDLTFEELLNSDEIVLDLITDIQDYSYSACSVLLNYMAISDVIGQLEAQH